ncbi:MAG: DUF4126 domain-containing protein [Acidobacteria bacterium]|nr:DUF4126 domain-containing protein [Acidobacteriaceae bacterium]MBV9610547.1 DUF4126 domain-containing protein [Acidobacteriota bacterium]
MNLPLSKPEIVGILTGASFASGLNVYATVATLGVLGRTGVLPLPGGLHALESWPVIAVSAAMFVVEFFADKIPAFDLIWNALHTFVRIPIAALIAYGATSHLSPGAQLASALLGAAIAAAAHGGKLAVRAAVTPSPEPVSNIALSLTEDAAAVGLTWFATRHPYVAAAIVAVLVLLVIVAMRWVIRAVRRLFRGAKRELAEI